jgi:hypothetical protein
MKYIISERQYRLIVEKKDYFTGSKFGDEEGNKFSVEKVFDFVKKNKDKYYKKKYPIQKIKHNLEWWDKNYDIKNPKHKKRMMDTDTSYPLLVVVEKNGNYSVADGLNRLYKAVNIEKKKTLPVYVVKKTDIEHLSQEQNIEESVSMNDMKNWFRFITKKDLKKHPGADTFARYSDIKGFQKFVDLLYRVTKKEVEFDGTKGLNVGTVWREPPQGVSSRGEISFFVRVFPEIDENNPPTSKEKFEQQYKTFQEEFEINFQSIGMKNVRFNFMNVSLPKPKNEMKEAELTEKCWPGYTQKGMKTMFGKRYPNCVKKKK